MPLVVRGDMNSCVVPSMDSWGTSPSIMNKQVNSRVQVPDRCAVHDVSDIEHGEWDD